MPVNNRKTLQSWSYSVYSKYIQCPLQIFFSHVIKVKMPEEPKGKPLIHGDEVHQEAQRYVVGSGRAPKLSSDLVNVKARLDELRKAQARGEQKWAFTAGWALTTWYGDGAWLRVIVDAIAEMLKPAPFVDIVDYKTGKLYDDHKQQRSLYGLAALQLVHIGQLAGGAPDTKVRVQHIYTDLSTATKLETATEEYTMKDRASLVREWKLRIKQMMSDTAFRPKVGPHCSYCKFRKSNGGPCTERM